MLGIYLAGPIRRDKPEEFKKDWGWRQEATVALNKDYHIYNPMSVQDFGVYSWDKKMIEKCDVMLFNFNDLGNGYPHIGGLWECGLGDAMDKIMIAFGNEKWCSHPFIQAKMLWFEDLDASVIYLLNHASSFKKADNKHYGY